MGKAIAAALTGDAVIVAGVDVNASALSAQFPIYENINDFPGKADVIIDFSHHSALPSLLDYAKKTKTPLVVATTGHTDDELARILDCVDVAFLCGGSLARGQASQEHNCYQKDTDDFLHCFFSLSFILHFIKIKYRYYTAFAPLCQSLFHKK